MTEPDTDREVTSGWWGDPEIDHAAAPEPAETGYRAACSCGFRAPLTHDTEDAALRAADVHVAISTPRPPSRYMADMNGDDTAVFCVQHPDPPLITVTPPAEQHQAKIAKAVQAHERQFHGGDAPTG
jgi:hypothetical protein